MWRCEFGFACIFLNLLRSFFKPTLCEVVSHGTYKGLFSLYNFIFFGVHDEFESIL